MTNERLKEIAARARGEDVRWDILPSNFDQVKALCTLDGRGCLREQEGGRASIVARMEVGKR